MNQADIISGTGVALIIAAFFLTTFNLLKEKSKLFFILNLFGGVLACWGSILIQSIPFTILEGTWAVVAFIGLMKRKQA
ncbi:hypothetical protein LBMAG27_16500 [Bacteroidota bacterium]|nr:hypothetical protein LBMAG27_16500 [Bacteroidota bacterium]